MSRSASAPASPSASLPSSPPSGEASPVSLPGASIRTGARMPLGVLIALAMVYVVWSSTYLALRYVVEGLPAFLAGGARYFLAGLVLYGGLRARGAPHPSTKALLLAVPVGTLMFLVGNGFVAIAERDVPSGLAAVACAAMPLFAGAIGAWLGERPTPREWLGTALGFVGVMILGLGDLRATPIAGVLLVLAPIGWAAGSVLSRRLPLAPGLMAAATQMMGGGLATFVVGLARGESWPAKTPPLALGALVYLGLMGSVLAFSAYTYLLQNTRPSIATSYAYVNPVLAVALGMAVAGERPAPSALVAGVLVVVGVAVVVTGKGRRKG